VQLPHLLVSESLQVLRDWLRSRPHGCVCRALLVFGNPLGNAIGDTVVATQHIPFLRSIASEVQVSVWSGNPEVWLYLCPGVRTITVPPLQTLGSDYDFIFFDNTPVPPDLRKIITASRTHWVHWRARGESVRLHAFGRADGEVIPLPPLLNHTQRIAEAYSALGLCRPHAACVAQTEIMCPPTVSPPFVYLNPYASSARKSFPTDFFRILLERLSPALNHLCSIRIPSEPIATSCEDAARFARLASVACEWSTTPSVEILQRDGVQQYFDTLASASLVMGPDTSSQHIAAAMNRPTFTFYPEYLAFNYLYWGTSRRNALHFNIPQSGDKRNVRTLATVIAELAAKTFRGEAVTTARRPSRLLEAPKLMANFLRECRRVIRMNGRVSSDHLSFLAGTLCDSLPAGWQPHICRELDTIVLELSQLRRLNRGARHRFAASRLRQLSSPRVVRFLTKERIQSIAGPRSIEHNH